MTFSATVGFSGFAVPGPRIRLVIGANTRIADYANTPDGRPGPRSNTWRFKYQVTSADLDLDGITVPVNALYLAGSSFDDDNGTVNSDHGLYRFHAHKVDTRLRVTGAAITSNAGDDDTYHYGDAIEATLTFEGPVDVVGKPSLGLRYHQPGTVWAGADYDRGTGTDKLVFRRTVQPGDHASHGVGIYWQAVRPMTGAIKKKGTSQDVETTNPGVDGTLAHKVDGTVNVEHVLLTSGPGPDGFYLRGDTIKVEVTFEGPVDVRGTPCLALWMNGYVVVHGDEDDDGVAVPANALSANGAAIRGGGRDAALAHGASAAGREHRVDGRASWVRRGGAVRRVRGPHHAAPGGGAVRPRLRAPGLPGGRRGRRRSRAGALPAAAGAGAAGAPAAAPAARARPGAAAPRGARPAHRPRRALRARPPGPAARADAPAGLGAAQALLGCRGERRRHRGGPVRTGGAAAARRPRPAPPPPGRARGSGSCCTPSAPAWSCWC